MNGISHGRYIEAVAEQLRKFIKVELKPGEKLNKELMEKFIREMEVLAADHPISRFNAGIKAQRDAFRLANPTSPNPPTTTAARILRGRSWLGRLGSLMLIPIAWDLISGSADALGIAADSTHFRNGVIALANGQIPTAENYFGVRLGTGGFLGELTDRRLLPVATAFSEAWVLAVQRANQDAEAIRRGR